MPIGTKYIAKPVFLELGEGFADAVAAARFPKHVQRFRNQNWAARVGLDSLTDGEWERHFASFEPLPGNIPQPLALRYHGHQFRHYNPNLGDGRGFLFAQVIDSRDGRILDLGTKGSGRTPYSRDGDGRLTLKGAVREILATEMLESLGVKTSKTFSVFETGESLERGDEPSPTRSSVLVRLGHSHVRFGTFQRFAFHGEKARIESLVAYSLRQYFPHLDAGEFPAATFLREVTTRSADLCASWMMGGFVHGVLNSDNMNITGESFDYGPYRFLPKYDLEFTAAYFDHSALYSYGRQPESVLWNLEQLALALSTVCERDQLIPALQEFSPCFNTAVVRMFIDRLGLASSGDEVNGELLLTAFAFLHDSQMTFEQFFHDWYAVNRERASRSPEAEAYKGEAFEAFLKVLGNFQATESARRRLDSAYFKRAQPCTLLIDEIESIWKEIADNDDWSRLNEKISDIRERGRVYDTRDV